ncbi:hypothetical protein [Paenibacillus lemnae]|uniref:ABC-2 transporter permease n=1 Tax=Paenibacillus lemnae TaxID=1330551 RepID=A0A848M9N4_PAELE|nr:hypothetical protein [Paenibacillus lemnae]NMO97316.1 hypothetical protein [Paenibacillus lemnae]
MTVLSQAMKIVAKEIKQDKFMVLWTIIFMTYMTISFSIMLDNAFKEVTYDPFIDFMLLLFAPMLGFTFSRRAFRYLNEDSYTQMLYFYRSIPVPPEAVMVSRGIMGLCSFLINGMIFFGGIYLLGSSLESAIGLSSFIAFSISWIGIGLLINGLYVYFEIMRTGKGYFWIMLLVFVAIGLIVLITFMLGSRFSLFEHLVNSSREYSLLSPTMWISLITGLIGYIGLCWMAYRRMRLRDLT